MPIVTDGFFTFDNDRPVIFWRQLLTSTNTSADNITDPSYPVSNAVNDVMSLYWKQDFTDSPATTDATITLDLDGAGVINYVAIAGHNLGTIGASIALSGAMDGSPQSDIIAEFVPADDSPLVFCFRADALLDSSAATESPEFVSISTGSLQIRIQSAATPAQIAVIMAGEMTQLPEGIQADHSPLPLSNTADIVSGFSENGTFLGRIVLSSECRSTASFANVDQDWIRDEYLDFYDRAQEYAFFWAWAPQSEPDDVAFAWLENSPVPSFDIDGFASFELQMAGTVE